MEKDLETARPELKYFERMTSQDYINSRVLFKIRIYFLKSRNNKRGFAILAILSIVSGLLVPLVLQLDIPRAKDIASFLALFAGALISLEASVFSFRDKYRSYKKTEDQLTYELMLYQTRSEPYALKDQGASEEAVFHLLVSRVESLIQQEREETLQKITQMSLDKIRTNQAPV